MKKYLLALAAILGCCAISTASNASVITATWEGTVNSFTDSTGLFGSAGTDLSGENYKLVFTVDAGQGTHAPVPGGDAYYGSLSAVLSIDGHDHSIAGNNTSFDITVNGFDNGSGNAISEALFQLNGSDGTMRALLQGPGSIAGFPDSIYTAFATSTCPSPGGSCGITFSFAGDPTGTLNFGSYSVSATPIPATLPLFVSALGGIGFVGWRHRRRTA